MPASLTQIVNSTFIPKLQKIARPELKLELITYESQQKDTSESLSLELIYDDQAIKKGSAVEEQVLKLEQQQKAMMNEQDVELMRGFATGLQTRQLEAFRKYAENSTLDEQEEAVEMLRGASGLQRTQLEALKKHAQRHAQEQHKSSQISAKVTTASHPRSRL